MTRRRSKQCGDFYGRRVTLPLLCPTGPVASGAAQLVRICATFCDLMCYALVLVFIYASRCVPVNQSVFVFHARVDLVVIPNSHHNLHRYEALLKLLALGVEQHIEVEF